MRKLILGIHEYFNKIKNYTVDVYNISDKLNLTLKYVYIYNFLKTSYTYYIFIPHEFYNDTLKTENFYRLTD